MAEQAEKAKQAPEKKPQAERVDQSEGEGFEISPDLAAGLLSLQQSAGNRAVGRLVRGERLAPGSRAGVMRQMAHASVITPGSAPAGLIQLFRSGRVGSNIQFEEGPENEVTIQIPFQLDDFEQIVAGIEQVIRTFGSGGRQYVSEEFQTQLRAYLQSVNHPSVGGSPMSRQRSVSIQVNLIRGENNRLERADFYTGEAIERRHAAPEREPDEHEMERVVVQDRNQRRGPNFANDVLVEIPYETRSFEEILDLIETRLNPFDPDSWVHLQDPTFQHQLRTELVAIEHPSVAPTTPAGGEEALVLRIELVRGEEDSVDRIRFTSLTVPPPREAPAAPVGQAAQSPTAEQTEEPTRERSLWSRFWLGVAGVEETVGDIASARWLYNRLNNAMADFEREFEIIGEHPERLDTPERVAMPLMALVFTILQAAVGLCDLVATLNPINLEMQSLSRQAQAIAGDYSLDELHRDFMSVMQTGMNLSPFAPLLHAWRRMCRAFEERNDWVFFRALSEFIVAIIGIVAFLKGVRGAPRPAVGETPVRTPSATPVEPTRISAPPEPRAAPVETPARTSGTRAAGTAESVPAEAAPETAAAPEPVPAEAVPEPAAAPESAQSAQAPRPPRSRIAARREAARQRYEEIGLPGVVRRILATAEEARVRFAYYEQNNMRVIALDHAEFVAEWNRLGEGSLGQSAAAWVDGTNLLRIDRSLVPEARSISPMASAVQRPAPRPAQSAPTQQVGVEARRAAARQRFEEIGLPGVVRNILETAEAARARYVFYEQNNMRVIALDHAEFVAEWNRLGEGGIGRSAAAWIDGTNLLRIDRSLVPEARTITPMASAAPRAQAESAAAQSPAVEPVQQGAAPSAQESAAGQQPSRNVGGGEQAVPERPRPAAVGRTPEIEAAARAGGIREFYLSTEVEAARGVLADLEARNLPTRGASAAAMEQRWNILVGTGETPIAILLEDGSFLYNRRILTPE